MADFKLIGGALCLDFVNTVGGRSRSGKPLREKLRTPRDLSTWAKVAGLRVSRSSQFDAAALARALKLREALYRIFRSASLGNLSNHRQLDALRAELAAARASEHLVRSGDRFAWACEDTRNSIDGVLWTVARSAADLLTSDNLSKVHQCNGDDCGWLFVDTSRNHSRQWCDMRDCGNRAKVKRFRERRRQT